MTSKFGFFATTLLLILILGSPAYGALSCVGGFYFSETAVSPSDPSQVQDAEGCVTINGAANTITVVLNNTGTNITNIPSVLDGFSFVLSGPAPTSYTSLAVSDATGTFLDCTASNACVQVTTFNDYTGQQPNPKVSPFEWGIITGASGAPINQTFSLGNPALLAGSGSLHPAGIVDSFAANNHLGDNGHNDYLIGPATFVLSYTGSDPTDVDAATFYFGTLGEAHGGQVPEPTSILLLGTVLVISGRLLKRRLAV